MITREDKERIVADLTDKLSRQEAAVLVDMEGLSIHQQNELRSRLREEGVEMVVTRKTLMDIALTEAGIETSVADIHKPLALVLGYEDVVQPAKIVHTFFEETEKAAIVGGLLGMREATMDELHQLARLPGRKELQATIVGSLAAPMQGLVGVFQSTIRGLISVLDQRSQQNA